MPVLRNIRSEEVSVFSFNKLLYVVFFFFVADFNIQDAGGKDRQGMLQNKIH